MGKTEKLKSVLEKARFNSKKRKQNYIGTQQKYKFDGYQPGEPGFNRKIIVLTRNSLKTHFLSRLTWFDMY